MRILLVEDDSVLADRLVDCLTSQRYVVDAIADGQTAESYALATAYDLIITDVGLPGLDGIALCERLRHQGCKTPILLMTAKDAPAERVRGLDAGADDHLIKPLNLDEFLARVRALLRRGEVTPDTLLAVGPLRLDPASCQVAYSDTPLKLTPKEYSLLELFMRHPERVFSRAHLVEHLWSFDDPPLEDSVKAHIKGLRRKLKDVGAADWIENVYGIGYRFSPYLLPQSQTHTPTPPLSTASSPLSPPPPLSSPTYPPTHPPIHLSTPSLEQAFQQSMQGLWSKYQNVMTQRLAVLNQAATAIQTNALTSDLQAEAAQAAHKLAGVLGMFDRDEGTTLARQLETLLEGDTWQAVPPLVAQLTSSLNLQPPTNSEEPSDADVLLLVSSDVALGPQMQEIGQAAAYRWVQVLSPDQAQSQLQHHRVVGVVIDIAAASEWASSLAFLQHLAAQPRPVPALALIATDSLVDRVALARTGLQRLLIKPVTPAQLWEVTHQVLQRQRATTAQVLVVDDDPLVTQALRPLLEPWGMSVTGLNNPQQFWPVLTATAPDLLILDVAMPQFSGIDLCQAVRTDPHWQNLPILFLTAHRDADTVQQVFRAGADDYISKPIVGPELLTRVLNRLERNRFLQGLAKRDRATGLPNYPHSQRQLTQLIETAHAHKTPLSLALIHLSDLRPVTVQYGPDAGQRLLQTWGQCFQALLPRNETLGYWDNGDFVIGLPELTTAEAHDYLGPLLSALRRQIVALPTGERIQPDFELAVVGYPEDGLSLQRLYQSAVTQAQRSQVSVIHGPAD
ncbi:response regulator [Nodosilinea sp. AN01ver1]|uniref:response regulator n=1 Tax=Nodosilinea sp. AN01ver1 TaxID=3423362 RepID=UPI003D320B57